MHDGDGEVSPLDEIGAGRASPRLVIGSVLRERVVLSEEVPEMSARVVDQTVRIIDPVLSCSVVEERTPVLGGWVGGGWRREGRGRGDEGKDNGEKREE